MKQPEPIIKPVAMFYTPETIAELQGMVEDLNSREAILAMMYTWNHLAYVLSDILEEETQS